jgi:NADH-quinone oxidoreductase subunit A
VEGYLPILILFTAVVTLGGGLLVATHIFGPKKKDPIKDSPYESGVDPLGRTRVRFSIHYYLIGILFVVFDIEAVFLFAWAVVYRRMLPLGTFILIEMILFVSILFVGYIYALRKGALEWESKPS